MHVWKRPYCQSLHSWKILVVVSEWESDIHVHEEGYDCSNTAAQCDFVYLRLYHCTQAFTEYRPLPYDVICGAISNCIPVA